MKAKPLTIYPEPDTRRAMADIAEDDHDRPLSKMIEVAMKAFIVLYKRDKAEARKLADQFDTQGVV